MQSSKAATACNFTPKAWDKLWTIDIQIGNAQSQQDVHSMLYYLSAAHAKCMCTKYYHYDRGYFSRNRFHYSYDQKRIQQLKPHTFSEALA